jgi:hypothetical protein
MAWLWTALTPARLEAWLSPLRQKQHFACSALSDEGMSLRGVLERKRSINRDYKLAGRDGLSHMAKGSHILP